jgi:hypothetical protein
MFVVNVVGMTPHAKIVRMCRTAAQLLILAEFAEETANAVKTAKVYLTVVPKSTAVVFAGAKPRVWMIARKSHHRAPL